jgi:hypothetical protein
VIAVAALLAGCGDDDVSGPGGTLEPVRTVWLGDYSSEDQGDRGRFVLDVSSVGAEVTGEIVVRSDVFKYPYDHLYLKGEEKDGALSLQLDKDKVPYQFDFSLQGSAGSGGTLDGALVHPTYGLTADFHCRSVEVGSLSVEYSRELDAAVKGLAFDGDAVWASTTGSDYIRMDKSGTVLDTVTVFLRPQVHWTSDALTSDGVSLFGHLPITEVSGGVARNESEIEEFTKSGEIVRSFRIDRQTSGLAWDGTHLWSLPVGSDTLYSFDDSGATVEGTKIGVPDLVDVAYDGADFWCIGWFLKRLYRIDRTGEVLRVYDLPERVGSDFAAAIAFDGTDFWYSHGPGFETVSTIERLSPD